MQVTGAPPGARLSLLDRTGAVVGSDRAGSLGGALFRNVAPGAG